MPNLKDLRIRINSVKSTQKITSAMKMVAAAKLRRAQEQAEAARPYSERMERMLKSLAEGLPSGAGGPALLAGTGKDDVHLLVVMTSDRGLCGGFNTTIVREARSVIKKLQNDGKTVKILCVGRKGRDNLRRDHASLIVESFVDIGRRSLGFADAEQISARIIEMFGAGEFDVCTVVYNHFRSVISQIVTTQQLIPFSADVGDGNDQSAEADTGDQRAVYEFEPDEQEILEVLLPRNLAVQIFHSLLENAASEHGARMTAMDSATRNAGDMIDDLTMTYNRTRQAFITKELIEIISGAEAL
ncbi:MAG: F0F1 ATP synthase subunit gamma [Rhodospirillaceae bacterium]|jgi:F-type H+-transporting ATPase subunit gamma|nr:F0F1 ATP synthase subunit gamma [Rhodospirillaceae bacterium]MBT5458479.1 F0F1 ATP synthase subunit gamma [Rhodospirillaceae bacterium]